MIVWIKEVFEHGEWKPLNAVLVGNNSEEYANDYLLSARQEKLPDQYRVSEYRRVEPKGAK